jgi:hypothetical protein
MPLKTIIHVNQHVIKKNRVTGSREPVLTVKNYKSNRYGHEVVIDGPCRVIYRPDKPLSCGAVCWLEVDGEVKVVRHKYKAKKKGAACTSTC